MSYHFGHRSMERIETCTPRLQKVCLFAITRSPVDFTIVHGWRGKDEQNELVAQGLSKTPWPNSKHNAHRISPVYAPMSEAIDFAPWVNGGIDWNDSHMFAIVAGVFFACASELEVKLRWGGDWDMDGSTRDQSFMDWGHLEQVT